MVHLLPADELLQKFVLLSRLSVDNFGITHYRCSSNSVVGIGGAASVSDVLFVKMLMVKCKNVVN